MENWQILFLLIFLLLNITITSKSFHECKKRKNAFGRTPYLYPLGIYVWGDGVIFGVFWSLAALTSLILSDPILFLLIASVFWLVRTVGETIYWFNQQFSTITRYSPEELPFKSIFHGDAVWFVFQIANQCVTVVSIITTVYLFHIWLP